MKIGIIGSGNIGSTAARLFVNAGHDVALSNSRGPDSLAGLVQDLGPHARAETVDGAARFGDVVLLAVPFRKPEAFPPADAVRDKIVIDATNPYGEDFNVMDLGQQTSSEIVAQRLPQARLVKAFNTIYYEHLAQQGDTRKPADDRRAIPIAGDDVEAKAVVSRLIDEIGFTAVDSGSLREGGRRQQPGMSIYNQNMTAAEAREAVGVAR